MTPNQVLSEAVLSTKMLLGRYLAGFTDETCITQAPNLPNHVAWNLGHLALTMHRVAQMVDGSPIPASDISSSPTGQRPTAFHSESISFGSKPANDAAVYPSLPRCTEIYNAACDRLAAAIAKAPESKLAETVKWGNGESQIWTLALRMVFHNGFHTGQIADLRRALGFKSIFA